jgi:Protein of unknown function (DUF4232)
MVARTSVAALVVLVTLGFGANAGGSPATRGCTTPQLRIRLSRSLVAAGNVGGYIAFTNRSAATCRLTGWPTLVAVRPGGSTVARRVRSTMFGPSSRLRGVPVVRLRPGATAKAAFAGSDTGPGRTRCPSPYRRLRVTPPGSSRSVVLSAWLPALDAYLPSCSRIEVTMVVPASALPPR